MKTTIEWKLGGGGFKSRGTSSRRRVQKAIYRVLTFRLRSASLVHLEMLPQVLSDNRSLGCVRLVPSQSDDAGEQ